MEKVERQLDSDIPFHTPDVRHNAPRPRDRSLRTRICLLLVACTLFVIYRHGGRPCFHSLDTRPVSTELDDQYAGLPKLNYSKAIQRSWAQLSPWRPVATYTAPPEGCTITQVNLLQRHGARHPSGDDAENYRRTVKKVRRAIKRSSRVDSSLRWLNDYTYPLKAEDLVPFGADQSHFTGTLDFSRYGFLFSSPDVALPFVRASGSPRVVDSATNWTAGFGHASNGTVQRPPLAIVISEIKGLNNTLNDDMCPNSDKGKKYTDKWLSLWTPDVADRLNDLIFGKHVSKTKKKYLLDGANVFDMMGTCALETILHEGAPASPFCALFSDADWDNYEYYGDLEKFYGRGYGQPLGPVQGVGWVNELLARLTDAPLADHTQTNRSLPFPLGRALYADFSHENLLAAVFATLGLFKEEQGWPLDPTRPDPERTWRAARITPFSTRLVVERMECGEGEGEGRGDPRYVRVLVNDVVHPIERCDEEGMGGQMGEGMCTLQAFVEAQSYARSGGGGDWEECGFEKIERGLEG